LIIVGSPACIAVAMISDTVAIRRSTRLTTAGPRLMEAGSSKPAHRSQLALPGSLKMTAIVGRHCRSHPRPLAVWISWNTSSTIHLF